MISVPLQDLPFHIEKPTLVVDKNKALNNIKIDAEKMHRSGVRFRPHFKTHQSAAIGEWFRDFGVTHCTVSSVDMAIYFAENGWTDITIAFPVNIHQIKQIDKLAGEITLNVLVESPDVADVLRSGLSNTVTTWINIDIGHHKAGIDWTKQDAILDVARRIHDSGTCTLKGALTHAGHSYDERTNDGLVKVYNETIERMNIVRDRLSESGFHGLEISSGDTPCCSVIEKFSNVDEMRPGNFIFYDLSQREIGSCTGSEIALAVACPVVAKQEDGSELVTYGGAVHLSKDFMQRDDGSFYFGKLMSWENNGYGDIVENSTLIKIYQEHGIVEVDRTTFESTNVGDFVFIVPVHSCLSVNELRRYVTTDGEELVGGGY